MPLPSHSFEQSPCYPIVELKQDETGFEPIYYCKLHPDLGSTFLSQIELHCRQKDAESHEYAIIDAIKNLPETVETGDTV